MLQPPGRGGGTLAFRQPAAVSRRAERRAQRAAPQRRRLRLSPRLAGGGELDENNHRFSYAASWEDIDDDGDLDLYVANDFGRNSLYQNIAPIGKPPQFRDIAAESGTEDIAAGMSAAWGDYDADGRMDLYVANMFSSAGNRIVRQGRFLGGSGDGATRGAFLRHARGNSLFRNLGGARFADVSEQAGVTLGRWAWSSLFGDFNNDGYDDLFVANGFITQEDTGDL
ncbi:MAG: VCBS repeat-containing protein [Verrucomicrobiales bacterium]